MTTEELGTALAARNERRMLEGAQAAAIPRRPRMPMPLSARQAAFVDDTEACGAGPKAPSYEPSATLATPAIATAAAADVSVLGMTPSSAHLSAPATPATPAAKARRATRPPGDAVRQAIAHLERADPALVSCVAPAARARARVALADTPVARTVVAQPEVAVLVACAVAFAVGYAVASPPSQRPFLPGVPTYRAAHTARAAPSVAVPSTTVVRGAGVGRCL